MSLKDLYYSYLLNVSVLLYLMPLTQLQQNLQRCNTMGRRTRTASEGCLSDGVWATVDGWSSRAYWRPIVNIHRLKSCRVIGCNLQQNA